MVEFVLVNTMSLSLYWRKQIIEVYQWIMCPGFGTTVNVMLANLVSHGTSSTVYVVERRAYLVHVRWQLCLRDVLDKFMVYDTLHGLHYSSLSI